MYVCVRVCVCDGPVKAPPSLKHAGKGKAPLKLLVAVEEGLRSYALSKNSRMTMGVGKITSLHEWGHNIKIWRKVEPYVTVVRKWRKRVRAQTFMTAEHRHYLQFSHVNARSPLTGAGTTSAWTTCRRGTCLFKRSRNVTSPCRMVTITSMVNCRVPPNGLLTSRLLQLQRPHRPPAKKQNVRLNERRPK